MTNAPGPGLATLTRQDGSWPTWLLFCSGSWQN